ncbi:hypothetical protein [Streptomyces litmocidini]|uniref:hypothetical protein n=1 Tax=Streptomyces litmocidini TaxID=67318 RepID=UPI00167CBD34|nr:hypothetical protein [Streptomyces litmocidini]
MPYGRLQDDPHRLEPVVLEGVPVGLAADAVRQQAPHADVVDPVVRPPVPDR